MREQQSDQLSNAIGIALGSMGAILTAAIGVAGTYVAVRSGRFLLKYADDVEGFQSKWKEIQKGIEVVKRNKDAVAKQLTFPFTASKKTGLLVIPNGIYPISNRFGDQIYFSYGVMSKTGKALGNMGYGISMKDRFMYPVVFMSESAKGRHPQALRALFKDMYTRGQALNIKAIKLNTVQDGGYAWARSGFDFTTPMERYAVEKRARGWVEDPSIIISGTDKAKKGSKIVKKVPLKQRAKEYFKANHDTYETPREKITLDDKQKREIYKQLIKASSAKDFADIKIVHPDHGVIKVGKEFMTGAEWNGIVDIASDNPGHRILKRKLGVK